MYVYVCVFVYVCEVLCMFVIVCVLLCMHVCAFECEGVLAYVCAGE